MTSASEEKWRPLICFFSRVGLRTYQHPCIPSAMFQRVLVCLEVIKDEGADDRNVALCTYFADFRSLILYVFCLKIVSC